MNSIPNFFFWRYCEDIANLLLWVIWECLFMPTIMIVSLWRKLWYPRSWNQLVGNFDVYLHAKINFIFNFFIERDFFKDTATLLFWELWECLTIPIKMIVSNFILIYRQNINFITSFFLKILQKIAVVILGNLGMPGHSHLKW